MSQMSVHHHHGKADAAKCPLRRRRCRDGAASVFKLALPHVQCQWAIGAILFSKQFNSPWAARAANQKQPKMHKTLSIDHLSRIS